MRVFLGGLLLLARALALDVSPGRASVLRRGFLGWSSAAVLAKPRVARCEYQSRQMPEGGTPLAQKGKKTDLAPILDLSEKWRQVIEYCESRKFKEASALLSTSQFNKKEVLRVFDAYSEDVSAKTQLMNFAAPVIYYEERRYGDTSLEDKAPTRQSLQQGYRNEAALAIEEAQSELGYILESGDSDLGDLTKFLKEGKAAFAAYLDLAPSADLAEMKSLGKR